MSDLQQLIHKSQIKPIAETLSKAFQEDPLFAYFIHNESKRRKLLPYIFQFQINYGLLYGEVYSTKDLKGAVIWLPSNEANKTIWKSISTGGISLFLKIGIKTTHRINSYNQYAVNLKKQHINSPHLVLSCIGVDPEFQGRGYASALLKDKLNKTDLPCYLNTQNQDKIDFYKKHGFDLLEESIIPNTDITNLAMLRS